MSSLDFDRRTLILLAAVFLVAVGLTAVVTGRDETPVASAPPIPVSSAPVAATVSATPSPVGEVVVEVVGKVREPQVVTLPKGSRVQDALAAAGGVRAGVDTTDQNLARVLVDGEQIRVGLADGASAVSGPAGTPPAAPGAIVDINTAGAVALEQIPGVGPVLAQRIVTYREQNGGFTTVEQLMEVSGIGESTFAQMQPMVTVGAGG